MDPQLTRDYSSISPSAKGLLAMKSLTEIPYARQAALLVWGKEALQDMIRQANFKTLLTRLVHFENRYYTVDQLLQQTGISNIFEIGSGFSFRGLHYAQQPSIHYMDTDLAGIINTKQQVVRELVDKRYASKPHHLVTAPLNVLDEKAFMDMVHQLPPGPVAIVNEGLLVYLEAKEKQALCGIIRKILLERGGCWITGDIYIRQKDGTRRSEHPFDAQMAAFLERHNVEANKFEHYDAARQFFEACGFRLLQHAQLAFEQISARRLFDTQFPESTILDWMKNRQSWLLEAKKDQ